MKYRIVQLNDSNYSVQIKTSFFSSWDDIDNYETLEEAKKIIQWYIDKKNSNKIKKVIEKYNIK